ncbi:MAG: hypothetical protein EBY66_05210 [Candidatus Fonsibacter lacus]|jgi:hypothetical protein|nr:hypothetical protein [Candidatus Fonsibacter lacus]
MNPKTIYPHTPTNRFVEEFDAVVMLFGVDWETRISAIYDLDVGWRIVGVQLGGCNTGSGMVQFKTAAELDPASLTQDEAHHLRDIVETIERENRG